MVEVKNMKITNRHFAALLVGVFTLLIAARVSGQTTAGRRADSLHEFNDSVRALVKRVAPSVVQLSVMGYGPVQSNRGNTSLTLAKQQSIGSGVIVDADGYIVTNAHVVQGARRVLVNIAGTSSDDTPDGSLDNAPGRTIEARIVGLDSEMDLALLKVEARNLVPLPIADYHQLRQGEVVFAFGSPEGLQNSVTMGVISSVARQINADSPFVFIQTDAPINPGNSGGPLVNVNGELIGLNTFIVSDAGGSQGLGFAIPSSTVAFAYPQLRKYGHVHRAAAGMEFQAVTPTLAAGLKLPVQSGVIISDVAPGSPADDAGLKVQDVVVSIDNKSIHNVPSLANQLLTLRGGDQLKVVVLRAGERRSFDVRVIEQSHDFERLVDLVDPEKGLVAEVGIVGVEIDSRIAELLPGLRIRSGVIVAARAANPNVDTPLLAGDVIHAINGASVETIAGLRAALDPLKRNGPAVLQIERDGKLMFLPLELD
jgi:serine protease Do